MTSLDSLKKLKTFFYKQNKIQEEIKNQTLELEWAHIYHDSIRGKDYLEKLPLNIGRWAGNYAFFYILNRVLNDHRPTNIIEFGLGESTKMISTYLKNELLESKHLVVEQNQDWLNHFSSRFKLTENTEVKIHPQKTIVQKEREINVYSDLDAYYKNDYDLFVIDGPIGSKTKSRIDILEFVKHANSASQFIIIMDDCHRKGEFNTFVNIGKALKDKGIEYASNTFVGTKTVGVIATEKYKWITSI